MNHGEHGGHRELRDCDETLIDHVLSAAISVHREIGPGLLESVYELALMVELEAHGLKARRQVEIPINYKGVDLGVGFRADIIIAESLVLEIKSVDELNSIHTAQIMSYLKLLGYKRGLLLNFNKKLLKEGIRRVSI
jgi:GxxExxY protein